MKKMIALLLVVCVMCSMLIVTASAAEPRSMMRVETVTKRAANVRKYPNTNSLVYGNLPSATACLPGPECCGCPRRCCWSWSPSEEGE